MHDIEDYHITPEQAARIARGIDEVRRGDWTIADDGSLYTLPIGSDEIQIGRILE